MSAKYVIDGVFLTRLLTGVERYAVNIVKDLDKIAGGGGAGASRSPLLICMPSFLHIRR